MRAVVVASRASVVDGAVLAEIELPPSWNGATSSARDVDASLVYAEGQLSGLRIALDLLRSYGGRSGPSAAFMAVYENRRQEIQARVTAAEIEGVVNGSFG